MINIKKKFYETTYIKEKTDLIPRSILGRLYLLFKEFEIYRSDRALDLLEGGERSLDIGCGNGELVIKCLKKYKQVYGIDIAETRLKLAEKSLRKYSSADKKRTHFSFFDADDKYPYPDNYFNAVTLIATLEHFFDPYQVMGEVKRLIKSKGQVIIQVPNLGFLPRRLMVLAGNLPVTSEDEYGWDGGHLHYFTAKTLIDLVKKYHFTVEKVTCSGVFASLRQIYVSLLGADIIISARKND